MELNLNVRIELARQMEKRDRYKGCKVRRYLTLLGSERRAVSGAHRASGRGQSCKKCGFKGW